MEGLAVAPKDPGALPLVGRPELECLFIESHSGGKRVEREGAIACLAERHTSALSKRTRLLPSRLGQLERAGVVMGDHLGVVFGPAEGLDPLRREPVFVAALGARDLAIGNVADEHVSKRVFLLIRKRRAPLAADELLALERVR